MNNQVSSSIVVSAHELRDALKFALSCCADFSRLDYRSVFFHHDRNERALNVCSTDGFHIAHYRLVAECSDDLQASECEGFLGHDDASSLLGAIKGETSMIGISVTGDQLHVSSEKADRMSFAFKPQKLRFLTLAPKAQIDEFVISRKVLKDVIEDCRKRARQFCLEQNKLQNRKLFVSSFPTVFVSRNNAGCFFHACALKMLNGLREFEIVHSVRFSDLSSSWPCIVGFTASEVLKALGHLKADSIRFRMLGYDSSADSCNALSLHAANAIYLRMGVSVDDGFFARLRNVEAKAMKGK